VPSNVWQAVAENKIWRIGRVPSNTIGRDGDFWLNDTAGDLYQKINGAYVLVPLPGDSLADLTKALFLSDGGPSGGPYEGYITPFLQITGTVKPTSYVWYTDGTMTLKVCELTVTYTGAFPTQTVFVVYLSDGVTPKITATDVATYSGPFLTSVQRTIS
jgi:hypothetical protein